MEIKIETAELQKRGLFLGLPCYGGMCAALFSKSVADLSSLCTRLGIPLQMYYLMNESLITRARAYICDEFMRSPSTHLMFIDSDIGFKAEDVIAMLAMMSDDSDYDVLGAGYPKKCISWEKIKKAVDKGFADKNPTNLEKFVGDYVFNPKAGNTKFLISEPAEVLETGTGFMMIRKKTLEKYAEAYPERWYRPDHVRTEAFDGSREIMMYFDTYIDPDTKRYLSEDYAFCLPANSRIETEIGVKTIKWIVDNKFSGKVKTIDSCGRFQWNNVTNHWCRDNKKLNKRWVKIETLTDNSIKANLRCTDDHRIAVIDDILSPEIYYVPAKESLEKHIVRLPQRNENVCYSQDQISFMIGTLFGDSSIAKNGQFSVSHCEAQREYLELKSKLFTGEVKRELNHGFGEGKISFNFTSPVNAQTHQLRNLMYIDGKKTIKNVLKYFDEKSLAFWYLDDGHYANSHMDISTHSFSLEDHKLLVHFLEKKWGISCVISEKEIEYNGELRKYNYLKFYMESAHKLFKLISKYVPSCLEYKMPEKYRGQEKYQFNFDKLDYAAACVKNVKYIDIDSNLYDIEVENDHNFVANQTIVHNCYDVQKIGMKVWLCPWIELSHVGSYVFGGSLKDLAILGASATADPGELGKINKKIEPPRAQKIIEGNPDVKLIK